MKFAQVRSTELSEPGFRGEGGGLADQLTLSQPGRGQIMPTKGHLILKADIKVFI